MTRLPKRLHLRQQPWICALLLVCVATASACSDDTSGSPSNTGTSGTSGTSDTGDGTSGTDDDSTSGTSGTGDGTSGTDDDSTSGTDNDSTSGTSGTDDSTSGTDNDSTDTQTDPCVDPGITCRDDQHCRPDRSGAPSCVDNTCDDLTCSATERCDISPTGGAVCNDIACTDNLDCPDAEFCDTATNLCAFDVCLPSATSCVGQTVVGCAADGSASGDRFSCGTSSSAFPSTCQTDPTTSEAFCSCEDDWDCPAFTECTVGRCQGPGTAPTCLLPAEPFLNVLPQPEITWGGTFANINAVDSPFPTSAQAVQSAVVVNLDDDNGDGLINELDFPEILFSTFSGSAYTTNGILRAIHGGGVNKGADFFAACGTDPSTGLWSEGDDIADPRLTCTNAQAILDPTAGIAAGDLDNDGIPEIVTLGENDEVLIFNNRGLLISNTAAPGGFGGQNPTPALVNLDHQGFAEIVIGRSVFTLTYDNPTDRNLIILDRFQGTLAHGVNNQGPVSCVSDLTPEPGLEVIAGSTVYRLPSPPAGATSAADCVANGGTITPATSDETAFCSRALITVWDGRTVSGNTISREGFCAVADVLGADQAADPGPANPPDGLPEVILINDGRLQIFNGLTGVVVRNVALGLGGLGGAPNVDDFDGDGFPEIGTAFGDGYAMLELQAPSANCPAWPTKLLDTQNSPGTNPPRTPNGTACTSDADCGFPGEVVCNTEINACVCLHNSWLRDTEDDSSRVTGSTLFDFNGDNAAEVVYNDECYFRIYNGVDGQVLFKEPSESRTRIEYPVVADIDNDGNAEIIFSTSNESAFCSERANNDPSTGQPLRNRFNNGIEAWGDDSDLWVSARRVWNQHSYHVTNIMEGGAVPTNEPPHWLDYNGRTYNTYRSQPRTFGVAPDLQISQVQVSSPDAVCGQLSELLDVVVRVTNRGDLRVGPGVIVGFEGEWGGVREPLLDDQGQPLTFTLQSSLEPGGVALVTVNYQASNNTQGTLPDRVFVVLDSQARERECNEDNNTSSVAVAAGGVQADLRLTLDTLTPGPCFSDGVTVDATVFNDGSAPASDVLVRFYAGNPEQGGSPLFEQTVPGPIEPGQSAPLSAQITGFPALQIQVYATVDPDGLIPECNDGNNTASASALVSCTIN